GLDPADKDDHRGVAASQWRIGKLLKGAGDLAGAKAAFEDALSLTTALQKADPNNYGAQLDLELSQMYVAGVLRAQGDFAGALDCYQAALAMGRARLQGKDDEVHRAQLREALFHVAEAFYDLGRIGDALPLLDEAHNADPSDVDTLVVRAHVRLYAHLFD